MTYQKEEFEVFCWEDPLGDRENLKNPLASAKIGPEGGCLKISNRQSPFHGTVLKVPAGALGTETKIQIREGNHSDSFGIAPSVQLLPDGLEFKHPVELKLCHENTNKAVTQNSETSDLAFFTYDNHHRQWVYGCLAARDMQKNGMVCRLQQF